MTFKLTVSPDFPPERIPSWFVFNTWLQKKLGIKIRLELYDDFASQQKALEAGEIDLIYANPYDATTLVREQGFEAIVAPKDISDEAVIAVANNGKIKCVEDLKPGCHIASTDDKDVHMMCMIMIEPADLTASNIKLSEYPNYVIVAKKVMTGEAQAGFFYKQAYDKMSNVIKSAVVPIVTSQISVIKHMFLVSPRFAEHKDAIKSALMEMHQDDKGLAIVNELGFEAWEEQTQEDTEFMIDLMDTLV
jgi:phosphonate transport system substrate-binding protein